MKVRGKHEESQKEELHSDQKTDFAALIDLTLYYIRCTFDVNDLFATQ